MQRRGERRDRLHLRPGELGAKARRAEFERVHSESKLIVTYQRLWHLPHAASVEKPQRALVAVQTMPIIGVVDLEHRPAVSVRP